MQYGAVASEIFERAAEAETESEIPKALEECPLLDEFQQEMYGIWKQLCNSRTQGFDVANPVSISDMVAYLAARPVCEAWYFFHIIRALDDVWLADARERMNNKAT